MPYDCRWRHRAAFVMWPHDKRWGVFCLKGIKTAFAKLKELIQQYQSASLRCSQGATAARTDAQTSTSMPITDLAALQWDIRALIESIWETFRWHWRSAESPSFQMPGIRSFAEAAASFKMDTVLVAMVENELRVVLTSLTCHPNIGSAMMHSLAIPTLSQAPQIVLPSTTCAML